MVFFKHKKGVAALTENVWDVSSASTGRTVESKAQY